MLRNYFGYTALQLKSALDEKIKLASSLDNSGLAMQLDIQANVLQQLASAKDHANLALAAQHYLYLTKSHAELEAKKTKAQSAVLEMQAAMAHPQYEVDCLAEVAARELEEVQKKLAAASLEEARRLAEQAAVSLEEERQIAEQVFDVFRADFKSTITKDLRIRRVYDSTEPQIQVGALVACSYSAFTVRSFAESYWWPALVLKESANDCTWIAVWAWESDVEIVCVSNECLSKLREDWRGC